MEQETCKKELVIEVPLDVVQKESDTVAAQYARRVRVAGFRPGHAPRSLVRQRFRDEIRSEVVQALVPKFFKSAVEGQKLAVVGKPRFDELNFVDDQPLTCKAIFEVYPEFELKNYKGLEVNEEVLPVAEVEVDHALEDLRQRAATFEVVSDRPAEEGDLLMVNYQGRNLDDPRSEPIVVPDGVIELGGEGTLKAFTEKLIGSRAGEVRVFEVRYSDDFPKKSLAGKRVSYRVEVQSIKKKTLPPMDDDLAKTVSEFATLEELRAKARGDLGKHHARQAEEKARQKLLAALLEAHHFPVPEGLVENQLDWKLQNMLRQLVSQAVDPRSAGIDWHKLREEMRPAAENEVRAAMLLEKIADAEKIEVKEEEVDETIRDLAQEERETAAALKTRLTREGGLAKLQSSRRSQKALDFVYRNAAVKRTMSEAAPISTTEQSA